jgi:hypothetical protein
MGSVNMQHSLKTAAYQLDLRTPGSSPRNDIFLKQMRQSPNLRMNARGRPQIGHLL